MSDCINLRERYSKRYRIEYDPAYVAEHGKRARADDPWLQTIPCQRGHLYPHGGSLLGVATNGRGPTTAAIARLPGVTVVQDGDDGINAVFPPELLPKVAALVKPRRKRQLSPEQRERLASVGKATRLTAKQPGVQINCSELGSVQAA
jgi:hypothetical protein